MSGCCKVTVDLSSGRSRNSGELVAGRLGRPATRGTATVIAVTLSSAGSAWLVGTAVSAVASKKTAPWLLGRAAGVTSYLLIVTLVAFGLLLSHPAAPRMRLPGPTIRLRIHVSLAAYTLTFTALHIVALASDRYAGVGWPGALVPGLSAYRPLPIALGIIALYAGLLAGITAAAAGQLVGKVWWPIHKFAIVSLLLVWAHGVQAGSDTSALLVMYLATGTGIVMLAVSRYLARTRRDELETLLRQTQTRRERT